MTNIRNSKTYKTMTGYIACSIVEGFANGEVTDKDLQAAWQYLVDTGQCWHLQGWYGRTATDLIESGLIKPAKEDRKDYYGNTVPGVA